MTMLERFLFGISDWWDVVLWTGAEFVVLIHLLIELIIASVAIFLVRKKSPEDFQNNWKKEYFKRFSSVGLFLFVSRMILFLFIGLGIFGLPPNTNLLILDVYFVFLWIALAASLITIWLLARFHMIQSVKIKVYLILLSIPIVIYYNANLLIAII
ncbi:hypothetical protein [Anaerovorax sp. IOR16]|uniref:hypothetical protein n=1 Tax=Anaerovorax sp. IOR16 TaxID=2773458 RepID=UPI0019CFAD69|nr:hypothetical protein [Anaerovorax sp. IOR16]